MRLTKRQAEILYHVVDVYIQNSMDMIDDEWDVFYPHMRNPQITEMVEILEKIDKLRK